MEYVKEQNEVALGASVSTGCGTATKGNGRRAGSTEVVAKAKRRRLSAAYKLRVLEEIDRSPGQSGAILRREGLYSSNLSRWREDRRNGSLTALAKKKRGPKGKSAADRENDRLRKENARLLRELDKANIIIGAQKKLAAILGIDLPKIAEMEGHEENGKSDGSEP